jgi:hypothetical protein
MAIFGTSEKYGAVAFGSATQKGWNYKRSFSNIPLGCLVRKQIAKEIIFRVRRGNGVAGAVAGELYQDRYAYVVPTSINNTEGQAARNALSSAVSNWKNVLSEAQKQSFNERANNGLKMSGYNLYVREFITGQI